MMKPSTSVIELKLTPAMKSLYTATAVGCILFAIAGLGALAEAEGIKDVVILGGGIGFFGLGGPLLLKLCLRDAGSIVIDDEGVSLDAYFATGTIAWENLQAVSPKRVLGFKYLGISVKDLDKFLATRQTKTFKHASDEGMVLGVLKIAYATRKFAPFDTMCSVLGWKKLPESLDAKSLMEFNKANFGFELMLQAMWLGNVDELANRVAAARPPESLQNRAVPPRLPDMHDVANIDPHANVKSITYKTCPMCAEDVRAEAVICRFCRHTFDAQRAAA